MKRKLITGLALFAMSTASYLAFAEEGYDNDNSRFENDYAECKEFANEKNKNNDAISIDNQYHQCMADRGYEEDELEEVDAIYEEDESDKRG